MAISTHNLFVVVSDAAFYEPISYYLYFDNTWFQLHDKMLYTLLITAYKVEKRTGQACLIPFIKIVQKLKKNLSTFTTESEAKTAVNAAVDDIYALSSSLTGNNSEEPFNELNRFQIRS